MTAKSINKDQKRKDIARAAMGLFAEMGFEAASMSQVAAAAGIGKGTIYEYFRSKDELIAKSIQLWMEDMLGEAQAMLQDIPDPEIKLKTFVGSFVEMFLSDEQMPRLLISIFQICITRFHDTTYGSVLQSMFRSGVDSITDILMDGVEKGAFKIDSRKEAEHIAINLTAFLDGICLDYLVTGRYFDLRAQVDHYMKYLLEADIK